MMRCAALYDLAIGGTAVGHGLNAHPEVRLAAAMKIARADRGLPFVTSQQSSPASRAPTRSSSQRRPKNLAASLMKIASDIRWLAPARAVGIGERTLPENRAVSSIMPAR